MSRLQEGSTSVNSLSSQKRSGPPRVMSSMSVSVSSVCASSSECSSTTDSRRKRARGLDVHSCVALSERRLAEASQLLESQTIGAESDQHSRLATAMSVLQKVPEFDLVDILAVKDDAHSKQHYLRLVQSLVSGEWEGNAAYTITPHTIAYMYSKENIECCVPNKSTGSYGDGCVPLMGVHAIAQYKPRTGGSIDIFMTPSYDTRRSARLCLRLKDSRLLESVRIWTETAHEDDPTVGNMFTYSKTPERLKSLAESETFVATLNDIIMSPQSEKHHTLVQRLMCSRSIPYADWLGFDTFEYQKPAFAFVQPQFIAAAMSRFATHVRIPVVLNAARIKKSIGLSSSINLWNVTPIDSVTLVHHNESRKSCNYIRTLRLEAFIHETCASCICSLYRNDKPQSDSKIGDKCSNCRVSIVFTTCGSLVHDGHCKDVKSSDRCSVESSFCVEKFQAAIHCTHNDGHSIEHKLLLTHEEVVFGKAIVAAALHAKQRCLQLTDAERNQLMYCNSLLPNKVSNAIVQEFKVLDANISLAETALIHTIKPMLMEKDDRRASEMLAQGDTKHSLKSSSSSNFSSASSTGSSSFSTPYQRLQWVSAEQPPRVNYTNGSNGFIHLVNRKDMSPGNHMSSLYAYAYARLFSSRYTNV